MKRQLRGFVIGATIFSTLLSPFGGTEVRADSGENRETEQKEKQQEKTEIRPQDDFFGYVNADALKNAEIDPKYGFGAFEECYAITDRKLDEVIDGIVKDNVNTTTDAKMIADYYSQVIDYSAESSDADKDFEEAKKEIEGAASVGDYLELVGKYQYEFNVNPIFTLEIGEGYLKSDEYSFFISTSKGILGTSMESIALTEDGRMSLRNKVADELEILGYAKGDAEKRADEFAAMAVDISYVTYDKTFTFETVEIFTDEDMKKSGMDMESFIRGLGIKNTYGQWMMAYADHFRCLTEKLSDDKNLENFKTWLLLEYVDTYHEYFSDKYKALKDIYGESTEEPDHIARSRIQADMPDFLGKIYREQCYSEEKDKKVKEMCENIKDSYRELISEADWLSEDGRSKMLSKLENIEFRTGGVMKNTFVSPDNLIGKDAYETHKNLMRFDWENCKEKVKTKRPKQGDTMSPQTVNACFWVDNVVVMTVAITEEPFFNESWDDYRNLGGLGMVIAHEVGHAFDSNCIQWDDKGNYNPEWLSEEDRRALSERADMCIEYYNNYTIMDVYHVDGELTLGENYADLGALECISNIPTRKEDFITMYEGFGSIWIELKSDVRALDDLETDLHSPGTVRVNAPLSSCDKFYEVYDVKEGDGMYVAPENRVKRW